MGLVRGSLTKLADALYLCLRVSLSFFPLCVRSAAIANSSGASFYWLAFYAFCASKRALQSSEGRTGWNFEIRLSAGSIYIAIYTAIFAWDK